MKRIKMSGGDEWDALTPARKFYNWAPGTVKAIKRRYNRRFRKAAKKDTAQQAKDTTQQAKEY